MQHLPIGADGFYTGEVIDHSVEVNDKTGSASLAIQVALKRAYDEDTKEWDEGFSAHDYYVYGRINLLGQKSTLGPAQKRNVQTVQDLFGWEDGSLVSLQGMDLGGIDVMVYCKTSTYEGKDSIKADGLFAPADEPRRGGGLNKTEDKSLASLDNKFAAQFRAIAKPKPANQPTFATSAPVDNGPGF